MPNSTSAAASSNVTDCKAALIFEGRKLLTNGVNLFLDLLISRTFL